MMAPFLEALGAALESVAEGAAEAEAVEAIEELEEGIDLPDDSGDRVYHSELPDDSGKKMPEKKNMSVTPENSSEQKNLLYAQNTDAGKLSDLNIIDRLEAILGTPEGLKELIMKHPEKWDLWKPQLNAINVLNDPDATALEKNVANGKLVSLQGQLLETATKDILSEVGFSVESKQRVIEGNDGGTRPDVIAHNNTSSSIFAFGVEIKPGETLSIECKCAQAPYLKNELRGHIQNQLSGQLGNKMLMITSDLSKVEPGLAESVCTQYGANLVVLRTSAVDIRSAIKEVART